MHVPMSCDYTDIRHGNDNVSSNIFVISGVVVKIDFHRMRINSVKPMLNMWWGEW